MCCEKKELKHLGLGYPLFFYTILAGIYLCVLLFIVSGVIKLLIVYKIMINDPKLQDDVFKNIYSGWYLK